MTPQEFNYLRLILQERSGLSLSEDRRELLEARLRPLLKTFDFPSVSALMLALMRPEAEYLRLRVAQAVSVQESYFFRDKVPFQYFSKVMLPKLMEARAGTRQLRFWCAAAATGQEPYSLAMQLADRANQLSGWTVDILATDFAEDALRKARKGIFSQFEVQRGLPVSLLVRYFRKVGGGWEITPDIRAMVRFRADNLVLDSQEPGGFDVIFCRNVLIYFDEDTKRRVLAKLAAKLAGDGYLVLGAAETTTGLSQDFVAVPEARHGVFVMTREAQEAKAARKGQAADDGKLLAGAMPDAARAYGP
ncbi:MAG: CheR family methyltransferase [Methyloceanibacter sp.]